MDYGSFGLWAGLLAGGRIVLPSGGENAHFPSVSLVSGYSNVNTPDMLWWDRAGLPNVEYIDVADLKIPPPSET